MSYMCKCICIHICVCAHTYTQFIHTHPGAHRNTCMCVYIYISVCVRGRYAVCVSCLRTELYILHHLTSFYQILPDYLLHLLYREIHSILHHWRPQRRCSIDFTKLWKWRATWASQARLSLRFWGFFDGLHTMFIYVYTPKEETWHGLSMFIMVYPNWAPLNFISS